MKSTIITHSPEETKRFGQSLVASDQIRGGLIITLSGDLGAGKTHLTQGLIAALGVANPVTSPTFTLLQLYSVPQPRAGIMRIAHIDAYRLQNSRELLAIGAEDYIHDPHTLTVIEWPEQVRDILPATKVLAITITHLSATTREVTYAWPEL